MRQSRSREILTVLLLLVAVSVVVLLLLPSLEEDVAARRLRLTRMTLACLQCVADRQLNSAGATQNALEDISQQLRMTVRQYGCISCEAEPRRLAIAGVDAWGRRLLVETFARSDERVGLIVKSVGANGVLDDNDGDDLAVELFLSKE